MQKRLITRTRGDHNPATRSCICEDGPMVVATWRDQILTSIALEHAVYCPMPAQPLDIYAYLTSKERLPA